MENESKEGNREMHMSKYKTESKLNKICRDCSEKSRKNEWLHLFGRVYLEEALRMWHNEHAVLGTWGDDRSQK